MTLLARIQVTIWLMKYGSSPMPWPSLRMATPHSPKASGLPLDAANCGAAVNAGRSVEAQALVGVCGVAQDWS